MKFVWRGWYDAYESLSVPTLLDENNIVVWRGGYYYGGELSEQHAKLKLELLTACIKYGMKDCSEDWKLFEDQRTPS